MQKRMFVIFLLLFAAVTLAAQSKKLRPGFNLFSKEQDVQLGKESAAEVEKKMKVVDNPELQAYIGTVGKKLTSSADAGEFPYTFKVVVDKSINAFALPGGPMYIHTGLLAAADNESQMAGVMAHEVSHVALRHGTNQASKQQMLQLPAMLVGQTTGSGSLLGTLSQLGINLGANSVLLKFSRSAETEADLLGTRLMHTAGYNPAELANFFRKLEAEGGNQNKLVEMFMASHPNPGNRVQAVQKEAKSLPSRSYNGETGQFRKTASIEVLGTDVMVSDAARRLALIEDRPARRVVDLLQANAGPIDRGRVADRSCALQLGHRRPLFGRLGTSQDAGILLTVQSHRIVDDAVGAARSLPHRVVGRDAADAQETRSKTTVLARRFGWAVRLAIVQASDHKASGVLPPVLDHQAGSVKAGSGSEKPRRSWICCSVRTTVSAYRFSRYS